MTRVHSQPSYKTSFLKLYKQCVATKSVQNKFSQARSNVLHIRSCTKQAFCNVLLYPWFQTNENKFGDNQRYRISSGDCLSPGMRKLSFLSFHEKIAISVSETACINHTCNVLSKHLYKYCLSHTSDAKPKVHLSREAQMYGFAS